MDETPLAPNEPAAGGAAAPAADAGKRGHVSVVFFHGIGQQRNYESTAQLLEAVDDWVFSQYRARQPGFTVPRIQTRTRIEQVRGAKEETSIVYVQADYDGRVQRGAAKQKARVRFYEGYWAPATVAGTTARSVLFWLAQQLSRPLAVLLSPWRSFARLRRGDLLRLACRSPLEWSPSDYASLDSDLPAMVGVYREFVEQREHKRGTFRQFCAFIRDKKAKTGEQQQRLLALAFRWHKAHITTQLLHLLVLILIVTAALASIMLLAIGALSLLTYVRGLDFLRVLSSVRALEPNPSNALSLVAVLLGALGLTRFLRDSVGDIQQFVNYEEAQPLHDRREKILHAAEQTLRHILTDPDCERVVIVAHSLGTAIALDTVLRLRRHNKAAQPAANDDDVMKGPLPLDRIQHFITCGSPIDKINYFFAALRSRTRSYETMIEFLRGDISSIPFSRSGRQPYIHWINFWDRGDPISGPIDTLAGTMVREQRVDNVQVVSYLWPDPAASHSAYFRHRDMIRVIYGAAFRNEHSFVHKRAGPGTGNSTRSELESARDWIWLGPGVHSHGQRFLLMTIPAVALFLIWTAMASAIPVFGTPPLPGLGAGLGLLLAGAWAQRSLGLHRAPVLWGLPARKARPEPVGTVG